jgi:pimeloyl-ACP methyl ester carboxylesterase
MDLESKAGFLRVDGSRLDYRWIGPGPAEATTLVFLHEGLGCVDLWKDFPDRLAERTGLGALVYSRPGYGRSDPVEDLLAVDYHLTEALEVLPKVLEAAGVQRAVLVGTSDGGTISLVYVGNGGAEQVDGVISMAAHVLNEEITIQGIREAREAYETTGIREKLARYHGRNVDWAFWSWCNVWLSPEFRDWNVERYLPGITVPVLVLQGEDDHYGSVAQVDAIARQVSGPAETVMIPDCGHSPYLEQPEATLDAMAAFIDQFITGRTRL